MIYDGLSFEIRVSILEERSVRDRGARLASLGMIAGRGEGEEGEGSDVGDVKSRRRVNGQAIYRDSQRTGCATRAPCGVAGRESRRDGTGLQVGETRCDACELYIILMDSLILCMRIPEVSTPFLPAFSRAASSTSPPASAGRNSILPPPRSSLHHSRPNVPVSAGGRVALLPARVTRQSAARIDACELVHFCESCPSRPQPQQAVQYTFKGQSRIVIICGCLRFTLAAQSYRR